MLAREQHYLDILFAGPEEERLNAAPKAGSSEGYKHPQAVKDLIASQRTGSIMSQATKELLSSMMSGPNNPFYGRTHSQERAKSPEFIHMQTRDKSGPNNPQYGVVKSASTIAKLTKLVHVYDAESLVLLGSHSTTAVCKQFKIGNDTLYKYLASGLPYKGRIYRRTLV
jgi:hypothetical protein